MTRLHKLFLLSLSLCLLLICPFAEASQLLPIQSPYPGGVVVLPLTKSGKTPPKVFYQGKRVMVVSHDDTWTAIVGIPLTAQVGQQQIAIYDKDGKSTKYFDIGPKAYRLSYITIGKPKRGKVKPNYKLMKLINDQSKQIKETLNTWVNTHQVYYDFKLPVQGRHSSPFGVKRIYNKKVKGRHTGQDIAARRGTSIAAVANGRVISTGKYVLCGNAVFVSHGQGLITYYCHMNRIKVKPGQEVKQGDILGTVGSTGRSTGPHVHWGVSLNGFRVNPMVFVHPQKTKLVKSK